MSSAAALPRTAQGLTQAAKDQRIPRLSAGRVESSRRHARRRPTRPRVPAPSSHRRSGRWGSRRAGPTGRRERQLRTISAAGRCIRARCRCGVNRSRVSSYQTMSQLRRFTSRVACSTGPRRKPTFSAAGCDGTLSTWVCSSIRCRPSCRAQSTSSPIAPVAPLDRGPDGPPSRRLRRHPARVRGPVPRCPTCSRCWRR